MACKFSNNMNPEIKKTKKMHNRAETCSLLTILVDFNCQFELTWMF